MNTGGDAHATAMDDTETEPPFSMEQFLDEMKEAGGFLVDRETGERFHKLLADVEDACAKMDWLRALLDDDDEVTVVAPPRRPCPVGSSILVSDPVAARRLELERMLDEAAAELDTLTRDYIAMAKHIAAVRESSQGR
ncbi:hypothetical protein PVAP13_4KG060300 [Panicum virgatum]|uniref:Uncharacterized protein n=1 Tax=Panicum virgatum TaxID=38727 RepID=A0A8T0TLN4_PANVG|nr:hypothetical protein PVAP13_4KG060300 [Panicum virgatum]